MSGAAARTRPAGARRKGTTMAPDEWSADGAGIRLAVDLVILTLREGRLSVLLVQRDGEPFAGAWALPGGFVQEHEDLDAAAERVFTTEARLGEGTAYLEQVRTFGAPDRDPRGRVVSVVSMALGADLPDPAGAPGVETDEPAAWWPVDELDALDLAFDHARLLDVAVERARAKLEYSTLATTFLPEEFTVTQLRRVYESVWGVRLDPGNFHRKATRTSGFLDEVQGRVEETGGRPARIFRAGSGTELNPPILRGHAEKAPAAETPNEQEQQ